MLFNPHNIIILAKHVWYQAQHSDHVFHAIFSAGWSGDDESGFPVCKAASNQDELDFPVGGHGLVKMTRLSFWSASVIELTDLSRIRLVCSFGDVRQMKAN